MPIELTMNQLDVKSTMHSKATMVDILKHLASTCVIFQTLHTIQKASPIELITHCQDVTSTMHSTDNLCDILIVANHTQSKFHPLGGHYSRHPEIETTLGFKQLFKCCTSYTKQHHLTDKTSKEPCALRNMLDIL